MLQPEPGRTYADFLSILRRSTNLLNEDPIRDEIFSVGRLEQYAAYLAGELKISPTRMRGRLLVPELKESGRQLLKAYLALAGVVRDKQAVSPAAEWFVDNFHIVEDQLRGIKRDLPADYYDELPKLAAGELKGYPRVYAMALAMIAHSDCRLDGDTLKRFLHAFQQVAPLRIGELWAVAITLRIALVEQLKPLALLIVSAREKRAQADALADKLLALAAQPRTESTQLVSMLQAELGKPEQFDRSFIVQLTQRLRDQDPDVWPAFDWLEKKLQALGTNTIQVVQFEHHRQAAAQLTVGNIISSMRLLSALDWRDFFESVSVVDPLLAQDPAGAYLKMDFATRDHYRHVVERIARRSKVSELVVIQKAVELGVAAKAVRSDDERRAHVGHYLIGDGLRALERHFRYRPRFREALLRLVLAYPTFVYLGSLSMLTALVLIPAVHFTAWWVALLAVVPASEFALNLLNHYITFFIAPKPLPKMDMDRGIPEDASTMVVIPTLFTKESVVQALLESLEVQYLANQDPHIYFALLGDFADAASEAMPQDSKLLEIANAGIEELNQRYSPKSVKRFYLFHRRRLWNSSEEKWIGWERKRGKLLEFNRLLRGARDTSYLAHTADPSILARIKYVITLDSDTQLPRSCAHRLIGTITHPLNRPHYCPVKKRVTEGYGILQPRVSVSLVSAAQSRFARIFSGNIGLDPYTTAVSDVYQDLFAEGSFTGKGLYVVDAFETALANRGPENAVLSHDLFEGSYARSALVTDVELFDDYPSDYDTFSKRQHRWTRGDWQIAPWLFPRVPDAQGKWVPNNLTLISRWKIFDNLRRSVVAPLTLACLMLAWAILPGSPLPWTLAILAMLSFPIYAPLTVLNFRNLVTEVPRKVEQIVLMIAFMATQAWVQVDAILRTLYRKLISKKRLLEWVTFAQVAHRRKEGVSWVETIGPSPVLAVLSVGTVAYFRPHALEVAWPFLALWLATPLLKAWLREKPRRRLRPLGAAEVKTFRRYSRLTWHFFETFVGPEDNWLAPDNFQEDPAPVVAHRTSPTNIGLQLLATAAAYDFGYIGLQQFIGYVEKVFLTIGKMQGMHGHLFNWYDTRTLEPLRPQYISTVDSGNLAGHLLTLKQTCLEMAQGPLYNENARAGLTDTLELVLDRAGKLENPTRSFGAVSLKQFRDAIEALLEEVPNAPWETLGHRLAESEDILSALAGEDGQGKFSETQAWVTAAVHQIREAQRDLATSVQAEVHQRLIALASRCDELVTAMDFRFLFDEQRKIFVIGYNVAEGRRDNSYYDLLASESRLTSFVAIAKGDVPQEHWFRLGRAMTPVRGGRALIAWTATMFEYLMPVLVMRRYDETLLDETYETVVARQVEYGVQHNVPWGISEAGYNARDLNLSYQYGPFGIPGLGLKRGLSDDLVVSPYATMLAAMINPWAALANLKHLASLGVLSKYGFFESIDYTPDRLPKNQKSVTIKSFMAHHQGMSLVALDNLLNQQPMQRRFHAEPIVQATQLLLQERVPQRVAISLPRAEEVHSDGTQRFVSTPNPRFYHDVNLPTPRTQLLSNGCYTVMVTSAGSGYSQCGPLGVSRWREDLTRDHWGHFFYIRNRGTGRFWSTGYQPTLVQPDSYEVTFAEDKVEFWRHDADILTHTEILVSPEDNVELRRISLTNNSDTSCELDVTSFMETTLAKPRDDAAHPAFSNLFVQTEFAAEEGALLATRRRRSSTESQVWGFHVVVIEGETVGSIQYETDRARFIGRGHSASDPLAISQDRPLSNTVGSVLDPIFSLRATVRIGAGQTVRRGFATGVAGHRDEALRLADKYHDIHIFSREADIAWTQSQVQLRHLNISMDKAHTFQRLAGRVIFSDPSLRPRSHVLALNKKTQSSLWAYGISGDLPIILMRISDVKDMAMVRELLHGHEYLRLKGLAIDLVILNERAPSYIQSLQEELQRQIRMSGSQALLDKPGGVFIRRADIIPEEDVILLKTVARVTLSAAKGTLDEQLVRRPVENELPELLDAKAQKRGHATAPVVAPPVHFFNGLGGFTDGGRDYVIVLREGQWTPAPWINVVANDRDFGFLISEAGAGYTWCTNSRENRLTSWSNDPVTDSVSEALYIRDEDSGDYWTPTPLPIRGNDAYVIRHGQGYSQFEHTSHGIAQELLVFVPVDDLAASVKISRLRLTNLDKHTRRLSVTSYVEWVLGFQRGTSAPTVITELDEQTGAIFATNPYNNEFAQRVAFVDMSEIMRSYTCDRKEFLGRNGSPTRPAGLERVSLSGRSGAGLDPCAAYQTAFELAPGEMREIIVLLGQADSVEQARALTTQYCSKATVNTAFAQVNAYWDQTLGAIEIKTPDRAMNTIMNRWLLYQTLSCRIWARSAFYQSGGAFGFRDQLQDVMALVYAKPQIAREQILRAAKRQFEEGDVQHWWHPPTGRGVRTRISDDLIWLPFVVSFYVNATGDRSVLSEVVPFIKAAELVAGADDAYIQPTTTVEQATIFEHCARALDRSLKTGSHGLPLMGSGDWNDGMNRVGHDGAGESVWLGWFLITALKRFLPFCDGADQAERAQRYRDHAASLRASIEKNAWDGDWYRRAFFDNGDSLGSAANEECRIDSIAQSWAVLSGAGDPQRAVRAMAAVDEHLVHRGDGLIKLFTPPFDKSVMDPGYIKGYVPGVRENGGQYTHAAIWTLMAYAELGDGDRAAELYSLLNPISHAATRAGLHKYKVEPYVVAADVYGLWPHVGRGGWTWYTGSASWMYRAGLESILGFDLRGDILRIKPCIPKHWPGFEIIYRRLKTEYHIAVSNIDEHGNAAEARVHLDGVLLTTADIPLVDDGQKHTIQIQL